MPIERVTIFQYEEFGQKVVQWSLDSTSRPMTLDELKIDCEGILDIPERITKLAYVDVELDTLLIRVPNKDMVQESLERFGEGGPDAGGGYPAPAFYRQVGVQGQPPNIDILLSRIADYTIAQCA